MENMRKPGDSNRITREYLDSLLLETRYLDSVSASTEFSLFGERFSMPIMTGALSHLNTFARPGGMVDLAQGAKDAGAVMWMGMAEEEEVEACASTGARIVEIIKPYRDRDHICRMMEQAEKLGLLAVGVDIDFVYDAAGEPKNFHGYPLQELTAEELKDLVKSSKLPFVVKGVLSTGDAKKALDAGVSGMVVSHHGYSLEYAVPPLFMLPLIAEASKGAVPIFADCEIQTGMDAYKAIALGASGVSIGRPLMNAIRENGAAGVTDYLKQAAAQLKKAMISTGCAELSQIERSVLYRI